MGSVIPIDKLHALTAGGPEAEAIIAKYGEELLNPTIGPPEPEPKRGHKKRKGCGCGKKRRRGH